MSRLITYEVSPPGGFCYVQPEPKGLKFRCEPMLEALAKQVAAYRAGNGLERASYPEALQDVDVFNCQRLGNNPRWCIETQSGKPQYALADNAPGLAPPCAGCGAPVNQ